jgi:SAM-dependent methyltransferase
VRDTDADWRKIGLDEPFWGVLTDPSYLRENIDADGLSRFYQSGVGDICRIANELAAVGGAPFHVTRALDFGCGVGRMSEAMPQFADEVVAYDISPGMLQQAQRHSAGRVAYVDELADGPFDWINSRIVFQHIPPERGLVLLDQLLGRLGPGGFVSLHFNLFRAAHLRDSIAGSRPSLWRRLARPARRNDQLADGGPLGAMQMYDYDLSRLCEMFVEHGVMRMVLVHEDHGGFHGATVFARRETT